ncbi:TolC family protein [uncultured Ilyobacter sp.]|uniref:TolC family protein n=1 Tax=uncultured Ilyobacter sp. TaxID=544433 RepID=UPI0029F56C45|nr:TolC family protein [uncultured Ilyobacter sp.]
MNKKKLIFITFLVIFAKGYSVEIGLEDVLNDLDQHNREILIQDMEIESQNLEKKKQFKNMLPNASLTWDHNFVENTSEDQNDFSVSGEDEANIGISMPLFQGGALYNQYKKSELNKEISVQKRNLVRYDIEQSAISTYFNILNKRKQTEIRQMVQEALSKQEERLKALYRSNKMIPKSELLKVQADLILNNSTLKRVQKEQKSEEEKLFVILDVPFDSQIEFKEYSLDNLTLDKYNMGADVERALKYSSKSKQEELILKNSRLDVEISKSELYPKLDASASYRLDNDVDDDETEYQVSLVASWEIFSWGSTVDNIKQKKINYNQAMVNYENAMDLIALEVRDQYRQLEILHEEVYSQKTNMELEEENIRIDKLRYENGIITTYDFLDSINRLSSAQSRYFTLQRDLILAMRVYENLLR